MKRLLFALLALLGVASLTALAAPKQLPPYTRGRMHVELYANTSQGVAREFNEIDAFGDRSPDPFHLPPNTVLVVTDVLITPNVDDGKFAGNIQTLGGNEARIRYVFDTSQQRMLQMSFGTGLIFADDPRTTAFATNPGACVVRLIGYLQPYDAGLPLR